MAGLNCDFIFSYNNKKEYIGFLNFRNVIALQVQRIYDATPSTPPIASGVPPLVTGDYTGIIVNGLNFGTGRVVSFSNPTSIDITENGRHLWKQIVNVEIYETGDASNLSGLLTGISGAYNANLQSLEEQFVFDISAEGDYQYTHSANIRCADHPTGFSGYLIAKNIASGLIASNPPFGYIDAVHSGFYNLAVGRRLYSETISVFEGSVSFEEKFVIQSRDFLKHSVSFDNGFFNVTETVTMRHSGVSTISGAMTSNEYDINTRYSTAFGGAYTRCNNIYSVYIAAAGSDAYSNNLNAQPVQLSKIFDERSQEFTYSVLYTNNPQMTSSGYLIDREQVITENALGIIQASETANIIAYNSKVAALKSFLITSVNNEMTGVITRMTPYYANISSLKQESESKNISILGKKASYTISYTSDPTLRNDGTFLSKSFVIQENLPIRMHAPYLILGRNRPLMHAPRQTELGNVNCAISATLVRPVGYNPAIPSRPDSALNTLFVEALNQALITISSRAPTDTFGTKLSYSYDSNLGIEVVVELQYLFPRDTLI